MALDKIISLEDADIFHKDHLVMSNVNLTVNKGEFIYLIGKTGSGKSSLLKTIYAEIPLQKGKGTIAEFDLEHLKKKQIPYLRRKIGIVFQDFQLLTDRSANENLLFVLKATGWKKKKEMEQRIQDVLEKVGLGYKGYKMPHELSGGEQQRLSIARALLNDPEIILADEPTGNLDPDTSTGIMELLFDIKNTGRAVIMATHDYEMLKKFNAPTMKIEDGKLNERENKIIEFDTL
ncbi:MAG: ATP-binding cassette domain-containing protein [Salinivirgaceae bacterium]|jgi:cell division transport system ATP-binding protein|nr:ATP-binding cassette domain-containing protein [Salinivirgaceae bacterium]